MDRPEETGEPLTIAALRRLIDEQHAQLTALRADVNRLQAQQLPAHRPPRRSRSIDRRALLGKAAAVLAGGAGLAVAGSAQSAFAGTDGDVLLGSSNDASTTQIVSTSGVLAFSGFNSGAGAGLEGFGYQGTGVSARSSTGNALAAECEAPNNAFNAVYATTAGTGNAVFGEVTTPPTPATPSSASTTGRATASTASSQPGWPAMRWSEWQTGAAGSSA